MIVHTKSFDIGKLSDELLALGGNRGTAIVSRSLNRAGQEAQNAMARLIAQDTGIQLRYVKREIQLDKANRTDVRVGIQIKGSRLPLIAFGARGPRPSLGKGRGVSWRNPGAGGRQSDPRAFIASVEARRTREKAPGFIGPVLGHVGVFKRKGLRGARLRGKRQGPVAGGVGRLPIVELRGPSLPFVFAKFLPDFDRVASESLLKNLRHEIDFANRPAELPQAG